MNYEPVPAATQAPVVDGSYDLAQVTDKISALVLNKRFPLWWLGGLMMAFGLLNIFLFAVTWLLIKGVGIWGVQIPVAWGFAITNFVWWIGIGHAGTFISAFLLLLNQDWRTSINRFAEAMTLFAVACAGLFPLLHLGRPWYFYWLFPYPDTMGLWPQFRSPLIWDVFAVSTYALVSLLFWYAGLIPDLATLRDRAQSQLARKLFGVLSLGWRGSARHWYRYESAYLLMAGLATPLVISVHSIVSFDFTIAIVPGWHSTILPPYFVAGAIFSGFAMVLTLAIPLRKLYDLHDFITMRHIEYAARLMLATGLIVDYSYVMESFTAWYSGNQFETFMALDRLRGAYRYHYYLMLLCNVGVPQLLWLKNIRTNVKVLFVIALLINVGMWVERYVIVVQSLHSDFLPSSWRVFSGTIWDYATFFGSIGLFFFLFFLFIRILPVISISEMRKEVSK